MHRLTALLLNALCLTLLLAACRDPFEPNKPAPYTLGGTVSGLPAGASVVLGTGSATTTVSANGAYTFAQGFTQGTAYAVIVLAQPAAAQCFVANATGTIATASVANVTVTCTAIILNAWTWTGGSSTATALAGSYGTRGVASTLNQPGARWHAQRWTDAGGRLWLFGGLGYDANGNVASYLNDLWVYERSTARWEWVSGAQSVDAAGSYGTLGTAASASTPGARAYALSWIDGTGTLWLMGGYGHDSSGTLGYLNDLWSYTPGTGNWAWMGGSSSASAQPGVYGTLGSAAKTNQPGARADAATWADGSGRLWLFGGTGYDAAGVQGTLADLWSYSTSTASWTWVGGPQTSATGAGVYGSLGSAASTNQPGGRASARAWTDGSGRLWLFGGYGRDSVAALGYLNDLWRYDPLAATWTWMSGSALANATGSYGTLGGAAAGNTPGARDRAAAVQDPAGNFWLLGGSGYDGSGQLGYLNDLWEYTPATGLWTWTSGSSLGGALPGVYGTQGQASTSNTPGARNGAVLWSDTSGYLWLLGGNGYNSSGALNGYLNDLWEFTP